MNAWRFIPFRQLSAFENMAIDEAIFRVNQYNKTPPTLRFYGWRFPSVSVGYFQDVEKEVDVEACHRNHYDIIRRPTGGKAVFHYDDLTYAVISRIKNPLFTPDILGTYKIISSCIVLGLAKINIAAEMADEPRNFREGPLEASCFSVPSLNELIVEGKKICGSAQVRSHGSFLQHGSLLISFDPVKTQDILLPHLYPQEQIEQLSKSVTSVRNHAGSRITMAKICSAFKEGFEASLDIRLIDGSLNPEEEDLKEQLLIKYKSNSWNMRGRYGASIKK